MAHWRPVESAEFTVQLTAVGDIKRLDERLRGLTVALWTHADRFPFAIPGNPRPPGDVGRMRIATVASFRDDEPTLTVWFLVDGDEAVLRWIEATPDLPASGGA